MFGVFKRLSAFRRGFNEGRKEYRSQNSPKKSIKLLSHKTNKYNKNKYFIGSFYTYKEALNYGFELKNEKECKSFTINQYQGKYKLYIYN